jgi:hypothetical protein
VCQLQQPQLQAMGVAQEHVEKILESVHILRQSMFGNNPQRGKMTLVSKNKCLRLIIMEDNHVTVHQVGGPLKHLKKKPVEQDLH